jgi:hypothetical protein
MTSASRTLSAFMVVRARALADHRVTESPSCRRWNTVSAIFFFASARTT